MDNITKEISEESLKLSKSEITQEMYNTTTSRLKKRLESARKDIKNFEKLKSGAELKVLKTTMDEAQNAMVERMPDVLGDFAKA